MIDQGGRGSNSVFTMCKNILFLNKRSFLSLKEESRLAQTVMPYIWRG